VAADDVILKLVEVFVVDAPLCHGSEAGVDAVDDLVLREGLQEVETLNDATACSLVDRYAIVALDD
jgi:hypothetical protein